MAKQLSEHTRLVDKKGRNQVSFKDMEEQSAMYMKDIFTTFVDAHWYYVLIAFFASFFGKPPSQKSPVLGLIFNAQFISVIFKGFGYYSACSTGRSPGITMTSKRTTAHRTSRTTRKSVRSEV